MLSSVSQTEVVHLGTKAQIYFLYVHQLKHFISQHKCANPTVNLLPVDQGKLQYLLGGYSQH